MLTSQTHSARGWEPSAGYLGKCSCCIPEALGQVLRMGPAQEQVVTIKPVLVFVWFCKFRGKGNSEFGGIMWEVMEWVRTTEGRTRNCWIKLGSFKVALAFLPVFSVRWEGQSFCLYSLPLLDGCESNVSLAGKVGIAAVRSTTAEDSETNDGYPLFLGVSCEPWWPWLQSLCLLEDTFKWRVCVVASKRLLRITEHIILGSKLSLNTLM